MALVTIVEHGGAEHRIEAADGETVMRLAVNAMIDGIVGECGGGLACATCHCYVDEAWIDRLPPPSQAETDMLDSAASALQPGSRLSCQITISDALDGLIVRLPEAQF